MATSIGNRRPLSPHLQIYRLIPTMVMSIAHRITGAALYFGALVLAWWLAAAAAGPLYYAWAVSWLTSWIGLLVLFGFTWALMHHLLGGMRHLVWDTGRWLDKHTATRLAWMTIAGSTILTVLIWSIAYSLA